MRKNILKENVFMERKLNKKVREQKAITLIALVITIIVLLILASVSIAMLTGENGLLTKATNAKKLSIIGEEKELINLAYTSLKLDNVQIGNKITKDNLKTEIEKSNKKVTSDNSDINGNVVTEESEYAKITFKDTANWYIVNLTTGKIEKYGADGEIIINEIVVGNIEIYDIDGLQKFQKLVNEGNSYNGYTVKLMSDIDLSSVCGDGIGDWTPIGDYNTDNNLYFEGTFEGNNHTISNLYINNTNASYQGFFGSVKNGSVSNLTVNGSITAKTINGGIIAAIRDSNQYNLTNCINSVNVTSIEGAAGGVVGHLRDNALNTSITECINRGKVSVTDASQYSSGGIIGTIRDRSDCIISKCTNEGTVNCEYIAAGGIVGRITANAGDVSIINCNNNKEVTAERRAGGIVGSIDDNTNSAPTINIQNCKNTGAITAEVYNAGGMLGGILNSKLINVNECENVGTIIANESDAGGIVGGVYEATECTISKNVNTANVTSKQYNAGGIIGLIDNGGKATVTSSYNTASIKVESYDDAGGIVGNTKKASTLKVNRSYNSGDITSGRYSSGGIVGLSYNSGTTVEISNSYNAGEIDTGTSTYGGILGSVDDYASAKISYCHNVGTLKDSKPDKGTMVGYQNGTYTGSSNYWLETCNASYSVGSNSTVGNKYTADQMKAQSNFSGWDFTNIWQIDATKGYPVLQ